MLAKVKPMYKAVVAAVAALVVLLNELTPLGDFLPEPYRHYFTVAVTVVGAVSVFLVKNEPIVEGQTPPAA
jgi:hypothetical protein